MQCLSRPNNVIVSQRQAERGSVQSADSGAAPAEGHLLWHWAYFRPCNYGPTISQVLRHHTDVTRSHKMGDGGSMSYNSSRMCQFPPTPVHTVTLRHCSKSLLVTSSQNNKMDKSKNKTFSFIVSLVGRNIIFPAHSFRILHPINRLAIKRLLTLFFFLVRTKGPKHCSIPVRKSNAWL